MLSDAGKIEFCKAHNITLFHIWETDINNKNFNVLDQIQNEINTRSLIKKCNEKCEPQYFFVFDLKE